MKFFFILISIFLFCRVGYSQDDEKKISVKELQEDFNFWRDHLESKSPMLYFYDDKQTVDNYLDSIYATIVSPMTDLEFYNLIAPTTSFLKDVHSGVQPSQTIDQHIIDHPYMMPIDVSWIDGKAYVAISDKENIIPRGTEVLSINGNWMKDVFTASISKLPNDGHSKQYAKYLLSNNFWLIYHRSYGFSKDYIIEYRDSNEVSNLAIVRGKSWGELRNLRKGSNKPMFKDDVPLINLVINESTQIATLTVGTFDDKLIKKAKQEKFKKSISNAFKELKADPTITNLIIDIRGNEGGDPMNSKFLLKHLLSSKFTITQELRVVRDREAETFHDRTKTKWAPYFGLGTFKSCGNNFKGNVYVLINGGSSSASGEFAGVLKRNNRATFIGSETGGNPVILSGSIRTNMNLLPNTKLKAFTGTLCSIDDDVSKNTGYGLIPDHTVIPRIEDLVSFNDYVLKFALKLIDQNSSLK